MASIVNADNGAVSGSAGLKYSSDGSGVLALQTNGTTAVSISTGQVATFSQAPVLPAASIPQAALAAGVAGNGPAFSAYANATQSIANTTFVKIAINTELFDTNSNFDSTTNYRFTPTVAGYYQINAGVIISIGSTGIAAASIYKNGSLAALSNSAASDGVNAYSGISILLNLNGSTDYIELYGYQSSSATRSTVAGSPYTYFQASLVRGA